MVCEVLIMASQLYIDGLAIFIGLKLNQIPFRVSTDKESLL